MRPPIATLCLISLLALPGFVAQAADEKSEDPLDRLIPEIRSTMTLTEAGFSGPGAKLLLEEAEAAEFFLIGESHGNAETPALAAWLLRSARPLGYGALAIEVGPFSAERMERLADEPDGMTAFRSFAEKWPFSIPFFWWEEEVTMALEAHALGYDLWGLDQEFIGSGRFLLEQLAGLVESEKLRDQVESWRETADAGFAAFQESGDTGQAFLNVIEPPELAEFAAVLPPEADRARRIAEELRQTAIVYQHYRDERYYLNNYDRIRLMKRHLAGYIQAAGGLRKTPKTLFKFGSAHMGRGYSPFFQLDLGNAAAELAAARFSDSFHLEVSTLRSVGPDGESQDWTDQSATLALLAPFTDETRWSLFDLRQLRQHFAARTHRENHPDMAELVFRYDVIAIAPVFHPAKAMIDLPF
jgi:hypothetical protein